MQNKNQKDIDITELEEHLVQENYGLVVSQALYFLSDLSHLLLPVTYIHFLWSL